jgi:hypothetical protein
LCAFGADLAEAALQESQVIERDSDWQDSMILIYLQHGDHSEVRWLGDILRATRKEIARRRTN